MPKNPQKENGYTAIANEIVEALAGIRISGEAYQCLNVILRKTYGFNKKQDHIALSQFALLTKMPKATVCRALVKLAKMNIIIVKNDNDIANSYLINKDYSSWKPLTKKIIIDKNDNGRWQKRQSALTKKGHTKETTTKDTITKETSPIGDDDKKLAILLKDLIKKNLPNFKEPDINKWAEDINKIARLDKFSYKQIEFVIKWVQQDDFWQSNVLSPAKLRKQFNTLVLQIKRDVKKNLKHKPIII